MKSNESRLIEDNVSSLINYLDKEYIESSFSLSSLQNNTTSNFLSNIKSFQINIEIPILKRNKLMKMEKIFYGCFSLISISNISNWDTSKVIDINSMFSLEDVNP